VLERVKPSLSAGASSGVIGDWMTAVTYGPVWALGVLHRVVMQSLVGGFDGRCSGCSVGPSECSFEYGCLHNPVEAVKPSGNFR
jgi:hypothetical protein